MVGAVRRSLIFFAFRSLAIAFVTSCSSNAFSRYETNSEPSDVDSVADEFGAVDEDDDVDVEVEFRALPTGRLP